MKIIPSIILLVVCFGVLKAFPAVNQEAEDSDEVAVQLDEEPLVIAGRWAPLGFNVNFSPWYNPFTSGIGDILKHLNTQVAGAMGNAHTNSTSKTEIIDGQKVTVNETMFINKATGTAYHMKVIDVQPTSDPESDDSRELPKEELPKVGEEDTSEMEDSKEDVDGRVADWMEALDKLKGWLNNENKGESSSDEPLQSAEEGNKSEAPVVGVADSSETTEREEKIAETTESAKTAESAKTTEAELDNEINHKEEDAEMYYIPSEDRDMSWKIQEPRGYLPRTYGNEVNNEVDVFDTYKPINMERDTLVNQLMSEKQHKSGLVMIDPDAELFDVKDGVIIKTYYNPHQRFQKIVT